MKSAIASVKMETVPSSFVVGLTKENLQSLKAPFAREKLRVKVQSLNKEKTRAGLVVYLQHTVVQDRLDEVDPSWSVRVIRERWLGEAFYVQMRMTLKGISRENIGEGKDPKSAYSDALKRCAMLFGIGRYLYHSAIVWVEYDQSKSNFKNWSIEDYERAHKNPSGLPSSSSSRDQLYRILMNLYRPYLVKYSETKFVDVLTERYGVRETRMMTVDQMEDLVQYMEARLKKYR
jgi:hypothetical protein